MDSPSIDSLLFNVPSIFELASVAGKRAIEIKKKNRESIQPLQQALDEICEGTIGVNFRKLVSEEAVDGEQIELPLEIKTEKVKYENASINEMVDDDDDDDDKVTHAEDADDLESEIGLLKDDFPPKIIDDDFILDDDE